MAEDNFDEKFNQLNTQLKALERRVTEIEQRVALTSDLDLISHKLDTLQAKTALVTEIFFTSTNKKHRMKLELDDSRNLIATLLVHEANTDTWKPYPSTSPKKLAEAIWDPILKHFNLK